MKKIFFLILSILIIGKWVAMIFLMLFCILSNIYNILLISVETRFLSCFLFVSRLVYTCLVIIIISTSKVSLFLECLVTFNTLVKETRVDFSVIIPMALFLHVYFYVSYLHFRRIRTFILCFYPYFEELFDWILFFIHQVLDVLRKNLTGFWKFE